MLMVRLAVTLVELVREISALQTSEKKTMADIKKVAVPLTLLIVMKMAHTNPNGARVLAKELVRIRAQIQRLKQTQSKLQGVSTRLTVR